MITTILIVLGALTLLVIIAALQPSQFMVARRAIVAASPSEIFPHVTDLPTWQAWSPWEKLDPGVTRSVEGRRAGVGNAEVGTGSTCSGPAFNVTPDC